MSTLSLRDRRTAAALAVALGVALLLLGAAPAAGADQSPVRVTVTGTVDQVVVDTRAAAADESMDVRTYVEAEGTLIALPENLALGGASGQGVQLQIDSTASLSRAQVLDEVAEPAVGDQARVVAVSALGAGTLGATSAAAVLGSHTLTVLPVYWNAPDTASQPSLDALAKQTAQYWSDQSAGRIAITATARPWAQIADPGSCDVSALLSSALVANGLADPSGNNHVLVYFPTRSDCSWAGLASIRGTHIWVNGAQNTDVMSHEFGHNLGLGHASTATCGAGTARVSLTLPVTTACAVSDYGDRADVMGIGLSVASGNLNSALADALGVAVVNRPVVGGTVTVDLAPLAQTTALRAVAVDVAGGTVYVDFRPAVGRDVRMPSWAGVQVHLRSPDPTYGYPRSYLLDMRPGLAGPFLSPSLPATASWQVPGTSQVVTVRAVGVTATVTVGVPGEMAAISGYVSSVYQDLFARDADPEGLATWTSQLTTGTPRIAVANAITASDEYRGGLIASAYAHYLSRLPDADGKRFWLGRMAAGMTIQQMEAGFISSDEYFLQAGSSPTTWVTRLYQNVLNRSADPAEVGFWSNVLNTGGSRTSVALGFLLSTEQLTSDVDSAYQHLLRRGIDPTGRQTWVTQLQSGVRFEQVIGSIIASDEYFQLGRS